MRGRLLDIGKVVVSLGLIVYLLRRVDVSEVSATLRSAHLPLVLLAILLYLGAVTLGCVKWDILLRTQGIRVPFRVLLSYTFVGTFFSNFLPANVGGDVMRGYGLARYTSRTAEAAVSVVVDRVVGLLAFMSSAVLAAVVAIFATHQANLQGIALAAAAGLLALALGFGFVLSRRLRAQLEKLFRWRLLAPFAPIYGRLSDAFGAYRFQQRALLLAYVTSLGVLLLSNFVNYSLFEALGGGVSLLYIFLFNPLIGFALLLPVSIGGLGVNQSAFVLFYGLVGVPERLALSVSLLMQMVIYLTSLPGGVLWWRARSGTPNVAPNRTTPRA